MWDRTVWDFDGPKQKYFDLEKQLQNTKLLHQIEQIANAYAVIHSDEIWNVNMLDVTLNQIQHCYQSGHFKDTLQVHHLFNLLKQLSLKLEDLATDSHKTHTTDGPSSAKLTVWYNELIHNNALILAQASPTHHLVFSVFDSPNFMYSTDIGIYQKSILFLNKLKKIANPISGIGNEQIRHLFFQRFNQKITSLEYELLNFR
jgi:hypothetical protein